MCASDDQCPKTPQLQTCACHGSTYNNGVGNTCVPSDCRVDSDCGSGGYCSPAFDTSSCGSLLGYYCHTGKDQCVNDSDCADGGVISVCTFSTTAGYWMCKTRGFCAL
jgi:Cys-rich repeat protein